MAFEFELEMPTAVTTADLAHFVEFTLGYDLDLAEMVVMSVVLFQAEPVGGDPHELAFGIRRIGIYSGQKTDWAYDHETARKFVPKDQRQAVMLLVLHCVRVLMETIQPGIVAMETFETDLKPQAMGKYMRIVNHMGRCGYDMEEYRRGGNDLKDYWLFSR